MKVIKLQGTKNVRDLCGIKTRNGTIKENKLIRGAGLWGLTKKDIASLINECRVDTIIDLRTNEEMLERPDVYIPEVKHLKLPIFTYQVFGVTHEQNTENHEDFTVDLKEVYKLMLSEKYIKNIQEIIKTILDSGAKDKCVLYHCTAGKDRTGVITAILFLLLGVDRKTIMDDYLYTNRVNSKIARRMYWKVMILERDNKKAEVVRSMYQADKKYLNAIFDIIDNNWDSLDDFITNGLKINKEMIEAFEKNILE